MRIFFDLIKWILIAKYLYSCSYLVCAVFEVTDCERYELCDFNHIFFNKATACCCRSTNSDTACDEWASCIKWDSVFIYCDTNLVKTVLCFLTCYLCICKVKEYKVVVCAA